MKQEHDQGAVVGRSGVKSGAPVITKRCHIGIVETCHVGTCGKLDKQLY